MPDKPKVGDKVYDGDEVEYEVRKVGRTYFYAKRADYYAEFKVKLSDWYEYGCYARRRFYPSLEALRSSRDRAGALARLNRFFGGREDEKPQDLSNDQLKRIEEILAEVD